MTKNTTRDKNRKSWTNLRDYELSYRHGTDALPQTRYFQCENPEDAFDAFFRAYQGKSELVILHMTVDNPYSHEPEIVDVHEILTQNPKYAGIVVDATSQN